jgi:hypothetical protein
MRQGQGRFPPAIRRIGSGIAFVLFVPVLLIAGLLTLVFVLPALWVRGLWLRFRWQRTYGRHGKRILVVYSESPIWHDYIHENWFPLLKDVAVILDWSERSKWRQPAPLEIKIFRHWGGQREFNPLAVLIPVRGKVRTIRFWQAFKDFKHGNSQALHEAETEMFEFAKIARDAV